MGNSAAKKEQTFSPSIVEEAPKKEPVPKGAKGYQIETKPTGPRANPKRRRATTLGANTDQPEKLVWDPDMKVEGLVGMVAESIIGRRETIKTAYGPRELVYADYTASGRLLTFLEEYLLTKVYPLYANSHTESSRTGLQMTSFREEARRAIAEDVKADPAEYAIVFAGTGSTGAMNKLLQVLGFALPEWANKRWDLASHVPKEDRPVVFNGPFEHHSNELMWRESLAENVIIGENSDGMPDLAHLERELQKFRSADKDRILIGSFSAGSNVTGLLPDVRAIASLLHRYGAYAFFDYAGSAAHVAIDMTGSGWEGDVGDDPSIDAIFVSPHKMVGGPGSSGILVARRSLFTGLGTTDCSKPTCPGGGTVTYVNQHISCYSGKAETREESGTPGILQDIRAGLAFALKNRVGGEEIERLEAYHGDKALAAWRKPDSNILLVGSDRGAYFDSKRRTSIISFVTRAPTGFMPEPEQLNFDKVTPTLLGKLFSGQPARKMLHCNFVSEVLNDLYGIQSRAGCVCAGPYAHRLYGWTDKGDERVNFVKSRINAGMDVYKPGWCRVNFNFFITDPEREFIINAVLQVAQRGWQLLPYYRVDKSGHWIHKRNRSPSRSQTMRHLDEAGGKPNFDDEANILYNRNPPLRSAEDFKRVMDEATKVYDKAAYIFSAPVPINTIDFVDDFAGENIDTVWWMLPSDAVKLLQLQRKQREEAAEQKEDAAEKKVDTTEKKVDTTEKKVDTTEKKVDTTEKKEDTCAAAAAAPAAEAEAEAQTES